MESIRVIMLRNWFFDILNYRHWEFAWNLWLDSWVISEPKEWAFILIIISFIPLWFTGWIAFSLISWGKLLVFILTLPWNLFKILFYRPVKIITNSAGVSTNKRKKSYKEIRPKALKPVAFSERLETSQPNGLTIPSIAPVIISSNKPVESKSSGSSHKNFEHTLFKFDDNFDDLDFDIDAFEVDKKTPEKESKNQNRRSRDGDFDNNSRPTKDDRRNSADERKDRGRDKERENDNRRDKNRDERGNEKDRRDKDNDRKNDRDSQRRSDKDDERKNDRDSQRRSDKDDERKNDRDSQRRNDKDDERKNDRDNQRRSDKGNERKNDRDSQHRNDRDENDKSERAQTKEYPNDRNQETTKESQQSRQPTGSCFDIIKQKGYEVLTRINVKNTVIDYVGISGEKICICLLDREAGDWLADEERFNDEEPLWFSESSHRISPVRKVDLAKRYLENKLGELELELKVEAFVVIQIGNIINAEDMFETWDDMNINVTRIDRGTPKEIKLFARALSNAEKPASGAKLEKIMKIIKNLG